MNILFHDHRNAGDIGEARLLCQHTPERSQPQPQIPPETPQDTAAKEDIQRVLERLKGQTDDSSKRAMEFLEILLKDVVRIAKNDFSKAQWYANELTINLRRHPGLKDIPQLNPYYIAQIAQRLGYISDADVTAVVSSASAPANMPTSAQSPTAGSATPATPNPIETGGPHPTEATEVAQINQLDQQLFTMRAQYRALCGQRIYAYRTGNAYAFQNIQITMCQLGYQINALYAQRMALASRIAPPARPSHRLSASSGRSSTARESPIPGRIRIGPDPLPDSPSPRAVSGEALRRDRGASALNPRAHDDVQRIREEWRRQDSSESSRGLRPPSHAEARQAREQAEQEIRFLDSRRAWYKLKKIKAYVEHANRNNLLRAEGERKMQIDLFKNELDSTLDSWSRMPTLDTQLTNANIICEKWVKIQQQFLAHNNPYWPDFLRFLNDLHSSTYRDRIIGPTVIPEFTCFEGGAGVQVVMADGIETALGHPHHTSRMPRADKPTSPSFPRTPDRAPRVPERDLSQALQIIRVPFDPGKYGAITLTVRANGVSTFYRIERTDFRPGDITHYDGGIAVECDRTNPNVFRVYLFDADKSYGVVKRDVNDRQWRMHDGPPAR